MAQEELSLSVGLVPVDAVTVNSNGGVVDEPINNKGPRLPRWTRQEILILIQGKRVAENRVKRGRTAGLALGGSVEPKWATVSSYCKRHGVNRGPVQCRKRWSNLIGDFKKIKEWESQIKNESDSFWVLRSDLRRDKKLPGFFDKEVYDILEGAPLPGTVVTAAETEEDTAAEAEAVFDSGRSAAADDGLFSDFEQSGHDDTCRSPDKSDIPNPLPAPTPISEKPFQPLTEGGSTVPGNNEKQPASNPEIGSTSQEGRKRRRVLGEDDVDGGSFDDRLIEVLGMNGRILSAQLEAQNANMRVDREERKDHAASLVGVLNKLADALGRIADKL